MSFDVQVGSGGYQGWKILERSMERQREAFNKNAEVTSAQKYFSENVSKIETPSDLVSDYRMLSVALRAFGLDADIGNNFFLRKVLESNPEDEGSLINKLSDKRYLKFNQAIMPDGPTGPVNPDIENIIEKFRIRSFEKNIGKNNVEIELALNAKREVREIAESTISENAKWYQILGSKPLRSIFETAFNLGDQFSVLPIDRQLSEIKNRSEKFTGSSSVDQFSSSESLESLIKIYLLKNQMKSVLSNKFSAALTLLRA